MIIFQNFKAHNSKSKTTQIPDETRDRDSKNVVRKTDKLLVKLKMNMPEVAHKLVVVVHSSTSLLLHEASLLHVFF